MPSSGNILQWIVVTLLGVAVVMVHSAGMTVGGEGASITGLLLGRPMLYAILAISVMAVVGHMDVRKLYQQRSFFNPVVWLLLIAIALCALALVPGVGKNVNGASRWIVVPGVGFSFQPSELAKWSMVIALAWWAAHYAGAIRRFLDGLLPTMAVLGFVCGLIAIEDLGTAALIGVVGVIVLLAAGAKLWQLGLMILPGVVGVIGLIAREPYRVKRLLAFLDPWSDPQGIGYHPIQSMVAVAGGQITGRGLGNGLQKFGYLPEDTTDFLFAVICEELGVAGAVLVIGLYVALLWTGVGIVKDCRHPFGRLLGFGILTTIGLQAVMNIAVVTVVVPTKGIALPLLSYGGTGWVMCGAAIGLLVAIDRLNRFEAAEVLTPEELADESDAADLAAQPAASPAPMPQPSLPLLPPAAAQIATPASLSAQPAM